MKNRSTIQLPKELISELKDLKRYKRETYEETIRKLMAKKETKRKVKKVLDRGFS